jgi:hypothetical protein
MSASAIWPGIPEKAEAEGKEKLFSLSIIFSTIGENAILSEKGVDKGNFSL